MADLDIIMVPHATIRKGRVLLEEALRGMGVDARIIASIEIKDGILDPRTGEAVHGTQFLLNGVLDPASYVHLERRLVDLFGSGYVRKVSEFEVNMPVRVREDGPLPVYHRGPDGEFVDDAGQIV